MSKQDSYKSVFAELQKSIEFSFEAAKLDFALEVKRMMDQGNITNTELAELLGVSKPMISKLLRGDANATIETMVKTSRALGGELFLKIARDNCTPRFFELVKAEHRVANARKLMQVPAKNQTTGEWKSFYLKANGHEEKPIAA